MSSAFGLHRPFLLLLLLLLRILLLLVPLVFPSTRAKKHLRLNVYNIRIYWYTHFGMRRALRRSAVNIYCGRFFSKGHYYYTHHRYILYRYSFINPCVKNIFNIRRTHTKICLYFFFIIFSQPHLLLVPLYDTTYTCPRAP